MQAMAKAAAWHDTTFARWPVTIDSTQAEAHLRRRERRPAPGCGDNPQPVLPAGVLVVRQELHTAPSSRTVAMAVLAPTRRNSNNANR